MHGDLHHIQDKSTTDQSLHLYHVCPTRFAFKVREFAWGMAIHGVTMPSLQHQMQNTIVNDESFGYWGANNHFTYACGRPIKSIPRASAEHYTTGQYSPFLGSITKKRTVEPAVHFLDKDPLLLKVKNRIYLMSWTDKSVASRMALSIPAILQQSSGSS